MLFDSGICLIDQKECEKLKSKPEKYWDVYCFGDKEVPSCPDKKRIDDFQTGAWTLKILKLYQQIEYEKRPYTLNDLSEEEWEGLGILRHEKEKAEVRETERQRKEAEKGKGKNA